MAQHIETKNFKQKKFREIEHGIEHAFKKSRGYMRTSMVYKFIEKRGEIEVYTVEKKIPKGIMWGSDRGYFEIHYDIWNNIIKNIYLVA